MAEFRSVGHRRGISGRRDLWRSRGRLRCHGFWRGGVGNDCVCFGRNVRWSWNGMGCIHRLRMPGCSMSVAGRIDRRRRRSYQAGSARGRSYGLFGNPFGSRIRLIRFGMNLGPLGNRRHRINHCRLGSRLSGIQKRRRRLRNRLPYGLWRVGRMGRGRISGSMFRLMMGIGSVGPAGKADSGANDQG